jgi:hypothetical protein
MAEQRIPGQAKPEKRPPFGAASDKRAAPEAPPLSPDKRIGFAVVGLGRLGLEEIIPAFGVCKLAKLTALMTGDPAKRKAGRGAIRSAPGRGPTTTGKASRRKTLQTPVVAACLVYLFVRCALPARYRSSDFR